MTSSPGSSLGKLDPIASILLDCSRRVLSKTLRKSTFVSLPQTAYAQLSLLPSSDYDFRLTVAAKGGTDVRLRIHNAEASCRCALLLRQQLFRDVSAEAERRDTELRHQQRQYLADCLENAHCECLGEAKLEERLLKSPPACLRGFPYLHLREWNTSDPGKGDLVFTDGRGLFAVVEVKYINQQNKNNKSQKRRKVIEQAQTYGKAFSAANPGAIVIAGAFTEAQPGLCWVALERQKLRRVRMLAQLAAAVTVDVRTQHVKAVATTLTNIPTSHAASKRDGLQPLNIADAAIDTALPVSSRLRSLNSVMSSVSSSSSSSRDLAVSDRSATSRAADAINPGVPPAEVDKTDFGGVASCVADVLVFGVFAYELYLLRQAHRRQVQFYNDCVDCLCCCMVAIVSVGLLLLVMSLMLLLYTIIV